MLLEDRDDAWIKTQKQKGKQRHITAPPSMTIPSHEGGRRGDSSTATLMGQSHVATEGKDIAAPLNEIMDKQLAEQVADEEVVSSLLVNVYCMASVHRVLHCL